ncbi:MAG: hypothetical protein R3F33_09055 [Planctomycetota bacterium]
MAATDSEGSDLLTFGEAAEFAGVSLMELRNQLRTQRIEPQWGWRGGVAVQLVALNVLERLYPVLAQRRRRRGPSLAERGISLVSPRPAGSDAKGTQPQGRSKSPAGSTGSKANSAELRKLYAQIEAAAAHNEALLAELGQAGSDLQKALKAPDSRPRRENKRPVPLQVAPSPRPARGAGMGEGSVGSAGSISAGSIGADSNSASSGRAGKTDARTEEWRRLVAAESALETRHRRTRLFTAVAAVAVIGVIAWQSREVIQAASKSFEPNAPSEDPLRSRWAVESSMPIPIDVPLGSAPNTNLVSYEEIVASQTTSGTAAVRLEDPAPELPAMTGPEAAEQAPTPVLPTQASGPSEEAEAPVPAPLAEGPKSAPTVLPPELEEHTEIELLDLGTSQSPACAYFGLTLPGQELHDVLGPCIGPWNEDEQAVAGGFRHGGQALCRHHYGFAKDQAGSVDRVRKIARYAKQEGLLPPLVRLRVEHGASELLQARIGKWIESGFEAGLSQAHKVTALDAPDTWRIESWVRPMGDPQRLPALRHFVMELQLAAEHGQDRLVSFRWVDTGQQ